jgi:transcription antitermination protein NusB
MSRAQRRSAARMSAVQALYEMDITQKGMIDVCAEFEAHWIGQQVDDDLEMREAELSFFKDIVGGVIAHQAKIDKTIDNALAKGWPLVLRDQPAQGCAAQGQYFRICRCDPCFLCWR